MLFQVQAHQIGLTPGSSIPIVFYVKGTEHSSRIEIHMNRAIGQCCLDTPNSMCIGETFNSTLFLETELWGSSLK